MAAKKALIIGHTGQDGYYLYQQLFNEGYTIIGLSSKGFDANPALDLKMGSVTDSKYCDYLLEMFSPDEIYYLAAVHQSSIEENFDDLAFYKNTLDVNSYGLLNILKSALKFSRNSKVFYASSSHIYGGAKEAVQNESTPYKPVSIYGISKVLGMQFCELYRQKGLFCSSGIFFNHESARRDSKFVSKKIVHTAVQISKGVKNELVIGDGSACIDWGFAPDYTRAAIQILNCKESGDFVISSGKLHTVNEFIQLVFKFLHLDSTKYVREDKSILLKKNTTILQGDSNKLRLLTGWQPSVTFEQMVEILVNEELENQKYV